VTLLDGSSAWFDARHAGALAVGLCRKGDLEACTKATSALLFGTLGPGEFVTCDAMLREIRDEALLVQTTAIREYLLAQARSICKDGDARAVRPGLRLKRAAGADCVDRLVHAVHGPLPAGLRVRDRHGLGLSCE
jgi:hypothetical protein